LTGFGGILIVAIVVGLVLVLAAVLLGRAVRLRPTTVKDPLSSPSVFGGDAAVERFRAMLRLPTVWAAENPEADHSAFDAFVPLLRELYPRVFAAMELILIDSYGIMLRWPGRDANAAPVVLMAHHDVVEADATGWTHSPFAADVADGRIYARGAVDTKCILAALFEAASILLEQNYVPCRDIFICSSNCEEDMGDTAPDMVSWFKKHDIAPRMVLDEGGAVIDNAPLGVRGQFAAIGVAEKGIFHAHCTVTSAGGHAATPSAEDAPAKLISSLNSMIVKPAEARLAAPVEAMLRELAARGSFGLRIVFANLWLFRPLVLSIMKGNSETAAMVRTTYALTELSGSKAANVIPLTASTTVNVRIDPAESVEKALRRLREHFPADAGFELQSASEPSPISPFNDDVFDYLRSVTASVYPEAGIAPYIQSSASDARHFALICPHTYRFAGFLFRGDQRARVHGQDENLDVDSFKRGVGFYVQLIENLERLKD
jgi:carboxypeptidase PM20D1